MATWLSMIPCHSCGFDDVVQNGLQNLVKLAALWLHCQCSAVQSLICHHKQPVTQLSVYHNLLPTSMTCCSNACLHQSPITWCLLVNLPSSSPTSDLLLICQFAIIYIHHQWSNAHLSIYIHLHPLSITCYSLVRQSAIIYTHHWLPAAHLSICIHPL